MVPEEGDEGWKESGKLKISVTTLYDLLHDLREIPSVEEACFGEIGPACVAWCFWMGTGYLLSAACIKLFRCVLVTRM